jgi:hypothetical protein
MSDHIGLIWPRRAAHAGRLGDEALGLLLADLGFDPATVGSPERFRQALSVIERAGNAPEPRANAHVGGRRTGRTHRAGRASAALFGQSPHPSRPQTARTAVRSSRRVNI